MKIATSLDREKLSIALLGRTRFYLGVIVGLLFAIILNCFSAYIREVLRSHTFYADLIIPTGNELRIYNFFFAAVSVTAGFGITVWSWFHGLFKTKRPRRRNNLISAYALFWTMLLLFVILKVGTAMTWVLYSIYGYDDHLNLAKEFPLLLLLLPTVFFLNIWTPIRLSYRSGMWLLKSIVVFAFMTCVLAFSSPVDQSNLNRVWDVYMRPYNKIVDTEIEKAAKYGVKISPKAVSVLRFNNRQTTVDQASNLKERFESEKPIPTDSVVIELILVKKTTITSLYSRAQEGYRWPFPLPKDIYQQIQKSNDPIRNQYLKELLVEYSAIFNQEHSFGMDQEDGLSQKYHNRFSMKYRYPDIPFETNRYLYLLGE